MESYWRSWMIDESTTDDDKITPVYKLDEICDLRRSSNVSIVREVSEFVLKRLEHMSPFVKQKALRLIKYAVRKSGPEFRREMQGDAVNKTVRDTAQETISTIFSQPENKSIASADLNRRIQGFGNTSYEGPSDDKKSFLSGVVGIGSASIKQGLSSFARGQLFIRSESGSHLQSSLTLEDGDMGKYEAVEDRTQAMRSSGSSNNEPFGSWNAEVRMRAVCVLDAIVRRKADDPFSVMASYFRESCSAIISCSESPQATLREKACKVLSLLDGCRMSSLAGESVKSGKHETIASSQMPNSIDAKDSKEINGMRIPSGEVVAAKSVSLPNQRATSIEDLLRCDVSLDDKAIAKREYNDPFADVSFHTGRVREPADCLVGETFVQKEFHINGAATLMDGLSVNENSPANASAAGDNHKGPFSEALFTDSKSVLNCHVSVDALNDQPGLNGQIGGVASKLNAPAGGYPYVVLGCGYYF